MLIKGKTAFVYDVEIFPNFFSVTLKNTESGNIVSFEISDRKNDMPNIVKVFLNQNIYFVGFNSMHYDAPIISYIILNYKALIKQPISNITSELKTFSDKIINSTTSASWSKYKYANLFEDLDLLAMKWSQKLRTSLKALQVTMQYKNVEEYDGDFNAFLPRSDYDKVLAYNKNDVESTEELLNRSIKDIELRLGVEKEFGISALNKDGVNLGMEIIKTKYLEKTGLTWGEIKDLRSPCDELCLRDIIFPFIEFKTPVLQKLLEELKSTCMNPNDNSFERHFILGGVEHTFGMGGVHSVNQPEIFEPQDQLLVDWDVASMYPSIIVSQRLYPQHLGEVFVDVYDNIRLERFEAKRNGNKIKNETYKLALNGLSGNLQNEYSWVYDPKMVLTIRINGQLMLLMLAEGLSELGCNIIQSNTDGTFVLVPKNLLNAAENWCKEWEQKTGLTLEADYFERFYQYAINDYLGVKKGWSETHDPNLIKKKGLFIDTPVLGKGMAPLIVPEALNKYFVEGIRKEKTIKECTDILKFCTFQKVAKEFNLEYGGAPARHINRYYMSMDGKPLVKYKLENGQKIRPTLLCADSGVTLYNKFDDKPIEERKINYQYYIKEVYKIINALSAKQLSLWN